jgi:hypothetical protein
MRVNMINMIGNSNLYWRSFVLLCDDMVGSFPNLAQAASIVRRRESLKFVNNCPHDTAFLSIQFLEKQHQRG